jgi:hypothetical protein
VIGAPDLLSALKDRTSGALGDVLTFSDREAVRALEEIIRRRPQTVALERQFAATPRGAALINRIKADPALADCELLVVAHDSDYTRVLSRARRAPSATEQAAGLVGTADPIVDASPVALAAPAPAPLDQRGTRRAPRVKIVGDMNVLLDGNPARLVDLSAVGAQVVSQATLRPNQRVRVVLTDDHGALRFNASIAWAAFEIPPAHGPRYRAGVNFVDADGDAVGAFCMRHKQP